jgi:hypothetical protein
MRKVRQQHNEESEARRKEAKGKLKKQEREER